MTLKAKIIPVTPFEQNCSLIWCSETMKGAISDAGGEYERVMEIAVKEGVTVEKLIVTHGHIDHAGAVHEFAAKLNVPIEGPQKDEIFWIEKLAEQGRAYGFKGADSFTPTRWLVDGDQVTVGNLTFDVVHCPGHTPGHVVFVEKNERVAIVGDVIFQGSIGRTDFPMGNHADLINAIRNKLFPLGDDITFIPGHGSVSTFGAERQSNPYVADRLF